VRGRLYGLAARADFVAAVAAMAGVLIFDTLPGLFIGIGVSLLLLLYRASRPHVAELGRDRGGRHRWEDVARNPDGEPVAGVVVLRVEAGLFFANADHVRAAIRDATARPEVHAVVLDAETTPFLDLTAAEMLAQASGDLARDGVTLMLARDVGHDVFPSVGDAVAAAGSPAAGDARPSPRRRQSPR
jgi:sulfate permease, SulP family